MYVIYKIKHNAVLHHYSRYKIPRETCLTPPPLPSPPTLLGGVGGTWVWWIYEI